MPGSILGNNVKRVEDPRFIQGEGAYIDDLDVADALHLHSVRSLVAHGVLSSIDMSMALDVPDVVAIYTADDLDLVPNPAAANVRPHGARPLLASDRVRFAGEVVAVVVAETRVAAADAARLVFADIDPLPVVATMEAATAADAPLLFDELGSNVVVAEKVPPDPQLFADADVVVTGRFWNQRLAPLPLEGSGVLAVPEADGRLTVWGTTQDVFTLRNSVSRATEIDRDEIHGRTADQGGGFGAKFYAYAEQSIAVAVARKLGRPVKWVETRGENLIGMTHGRAQLQHVEIGATSDGRVTALRVNVDQDVGAYPTFGAESPSYTRLMASGPYRIPRIEFSFRGIATNTMSVHAYRGAGRPEATALLERSMDLLATELDIDPVELRRRNFFQPADFPLTTAVGANYDTGDYEAALDRALNIADYAKLRADQATRRAEGSQVQLGIGVSSYVEVTAIDDAVEWAAADVNDDGTVTLRVGTGGTGQGHETAFAQIAAQQFKIPHTTVDVVFGDTDRVVRGSGTGGSRSLQIGGAALVEAGELVLDKARRLVAHLREADPADVVVMEGGKVGIAGVPDSAMTWPELAVLARDEASLPPGVEPGLGAQTTFDQGDGSYPFGTHISVVEVDTETGDVSVQRHIAVDDAGPILNRWLLDGQVHGGIAQGLGQALFEEVQYDEDGNPLTANLVSYLVPLAPNVPAFEVDHTETPTHLNPLGVKGIGEAATIGSTPAIQNAVIDAVRHLGVQHIDMPLTPNRVWNAIRAAQDGRYV